MDPNELARLREVSARIAARTDIRDVRFEEVSGRLLREPPGDQPLRFALNPKIEFGPLADERFAVSATYAVEVSAGGSSDSESEGAAAGFGTEVGTPPGIGSEAGPGDFVVAELLLVVSGLFRIDPSAGLERLDIATVSEDEISAYARSMGLFALHPYARSAVSNLTSMLGLPPLTLPVLRIAVAPPSE